MAHREKPPEILRQDAVEADIVPSSHPATASGAQGPVGAVATALADSLRSGVVMFIAADEQRAASVAAATRAAAPDAIVVHLPSTDALPGDRSPPSPANAGRRAAAFRRMRQHVGADTVCLVTTVEAAVRLYPNPTAFDAAPPRLERGQSVDLETLSDTLRSIGYVHDNRVDEPGEMAVRGQVLDLFPGDAEKPYRVEIEAGKVVALRGFDPVTQLSVYECLKLDIGRVLEPPTGAEPTSLFSHAPDAKLFLDPGLTHRRQRYLKLVDGASERGAAPIVLTVADAEWDAMLERATRLSFEEAASVPRFAHRTNPLKAFASWAHGRLDERERLVLAGSARDLRFLRRRLPRNLAQEPVEIGSWSDARTSAHPLMLLEMAVDRGWRASGIAVVAAADLLGSRAVVAEHIVPAGFPGSDAGAMLPGDVVVHEEFGIGVIAGLEALPAPDGADGGDAIVLEYAGGGRRFVPAAEADRIWRYGADREAVSLDRLDGSSWLKRRRAIDEAIAQSARELAALAAERAACDAPVIDPPTDAYERFADDFGYTETPDQTRAINAIRSDLASGHPMDRLVVGDVGYGKTEVALRAAALVALSGRQVAIAAPTTVLVRQHLALFERRFRSFGVGVAGLSRLSTPAERTAALKGLADGSVSIVIGTAAIGGKGVTYKDLGLVIVDEEQRFGAADKSKLRNLGALHLLTLSATPIPRTLQAALVGLQHMSVIATPPARRQPVRASVAMFDDAVVRTALMREQGRGGQSFVVVSRIEDMAPMAERLARVVPHLNVLMAHGKMPAAQIDDAMVRFASGDGDVLLATNIIEAGLDVPRANTIVVWHADRFGLSQLHQLRGRVGRGERRGQLLLTTAPDSVVSEATLKRLRTIQSLDALGAGFAISARDLDMRGAGDLLGEAQAGHMKLIGIDLYQHLLELGLRRARGEAVDRWTPELHVAVAGRLPEAWIPDVSVRLALYARLSRIVSTSELDGFEDELIDRFGKLPEEAETLLRISGLRILARDTCVRRIDAGPAAIALTFDGPVPPSAHSLGLDEKNGRHILRDTIADVGDRLKRTSTLLAGLSVPDE